MHASHPADAAPPLLFAGPHLHGRSDSLTQDRRYSRRTSPVHVSNPRVFLMHVADHAELLAILNTFASASVLGVRSGRFGVGAFGERERWFIPNSAVGVWAVDLRRISVSRLRYTATVVDCVRAAPALVIACGGSR